MGAEKAIISSRLGKLGCGVWRLEFHAKLRGGKPVPHWHILFWLREANEEDIVRRIRHWWRGGGRWAQSGKEWSTEAAEGVFVTSGSQVRGTWYLAMHAAKKTQSPPFEVDRWWGFTDRKTVVRSIEFNFEEDLSVREMVWWSRLFRRSTGIQVRARETGRLCQPQGSS